ncbi:MAG: hypothetical protein OIN84_03350 [Candidatus Methanoperedens sp.]|uniref:hypothetical protein n=1 Tax=Candidatus Methanoperedens sp. BLZ2 TaxID=2035255 RepID=UPI001596EC06|nr:hypothetical protein [Candidatus Methanoperedens sp. BLZ2]MBZ0174838.1 hypothetical protein [Candidatus Methanoperedens nitroreducens]MCX9076992.1 hypothetical protein [Candidatus Methanoperedens sp.]
MKSLDKTTNNANQRPHRLSHAPMRIIPAAPDSPNSYRGTTNLRPPITRYPALVE